jgi:hypothetical protein
MRVLICGSRDWDDVACIERVVQELAAADPDLVVIEGEARGADSIARDAARRLGVPVIKYPADWVSYGRAAGPMRNQQMLDAGPDLVVAFHPNIAESKGTRDMVMRAGRAGIPVRLVLR